jgi:hypothetical protein
VGAGHVAEVKVSKQVWTRWAELSEYRKPAITLLLVSRQSREKVLAALGKARRALTPADPLSEFVVGRCEAMVVPQGVALEISQGPSDFETLLGLIADGVAQRGITGRFEVLENDAPDPPDEIPLVECRLRVRGERRPLDVRFQWFPEPDAIQRLALAAARWCLALPGAEGGSLKISTFPRVMLDPAQDLEDLIRVTITRVGIYWFGIGAVAGGRWRLATIRPDGRNGGTVGLVQAGPRMLEPGGKWREAVADVKEFMVEHLDDLSYGLVKHGSWMSAAILRSSLMYDWPTLPGVRSNLGEAWEDQYAPRPFAVQLLGPGFADRLPDHPDWRITPLRDGFVFLEHRRPDRWFEIPFAPFGGCRNLQSPPLDPPPGVFTEALEDLSALLITEEIGLSGP